MRTLKSALIGAGICGILGPAIALALFNIEMGAFSIRQCITLVYLVLKEWIFAAAAIGPEAFVLGAAAGCLLQSVADRCRSMKATLVAAAMIGVALGSAVPTAALLIAYKSSGPREGYSLKGEMRSSLPVAATTGVICAFLVLWVLHRMHLLYRLKKRTS